MVLNILILIAIVGAGRQIPLSARIRIPQFLHITDFHLDNTYIENSTLESTCRDGTTSGTAGPFGNPESGCDSPLALIDSTFAFIKQINVDFVVWTGDNSRHESDQFPKSWEEIKDENQMLTDKMKKTYTVPVVPSIGTLVLI